MSTSFPNSLDSLTNPTATDDTATISHADQHANANDAIEALQAKVGIDSSAVTTSLDYRVATLESGSGGNVVGPESSVDDRIVTFDGTTGKLIQDGGSTIANVLDRSNHTGTQTASTISDFDTEVANNSAVTANTAKVTNATHTGDVTGDTALTIANDAVTNAKLANVATSTIKGRVTAATGDPEDLTATQVRTLLNVADGATANSSDATLLDRANHTGTQTASTISDFDTEVSNNTDVSANTSARHSALTVTDSSEIDFTLTGQDLTASIVAGSIDETKLDTSVNASLDLADSSYQPGGTDVALADGGTGASLTDPNADRILFWDDSAGAMTWLTASTGLTISTTSMTVRTSSTSQTGIVELATTAETQTGTDTARAVTPAGATATFAQLSHTHTASQVTDFDTEVSNNTDVSANTTHRTSTGADHTYIDQDVTSGSSPTFDGANFSGIKVSKALTVESPTSSEDISMFFTEEAVTITKMACVLVGSSTPSVTWTIRHSTDRSGAGNEVVTSGTTTTSTTTGSIVTSFNDATVPANSYVWFETTAQSGTVDSLNVTVIYDKD